MCSHDFNRQNEQGMMVVEAVLSFTVFIVVLLTIASLTNIFIVHNKIQFAMNSAARHMSSYTYLYQATQLRSAEQKVKADGKEYVDDINDTTQKVIDCINQFQKDFNDMESINEVSLEPNEIKNTIETLEKDVNDTKEAYDTAYYKVENLLSDPNRIIVGITYMCANSVTDYLKSLVASASGKCLTKIYLDNGNMSADEFLKSYGVVGGCDGLDFSKSSMLCDEDLRIIDLVVEYDIDLSYANISRMLVPSGKIHIIQRVSVPAWIDGDGGKVDVS